MKKKITRTQKLSKRWKGAKIAAHGGTYLCPFLPATILTIVNANEWFAAKSWSVSLGFITLIISLLTCLIGIMKKDKLFKKNVSAIFPFAIALLCFGISFMFLGSIAENLGLMFIFIACGCVASGICHQVEIKVIDRKVLWYESILSEAGLNEKQLKTERKKQMAIELARKEAEDLGDIL